MKKLFVVLIALSCFVFCREPEDDGLVKDGYIPSKNVPEGAVDMGLLITREDGSKYRLLWADRNLSASKPTGYGARYAWGEIETKKTYTPDNYKWAIGAKDILTPENYYVLQLNLTKYCPSDMASQWGGPGFPDNLLDFADDNYADDPAANKLGEGWRVASADEWRQMFANCITGTTYQKKVYGLLMVSKNTGNTIFLPACGDTEEPYNDECYYITSTVTADNPSFAQVMAWTMSGKVVHGMGNHERWIGISVRPVYEQEYE